MSKASKWADTINGPKPFRLVHIMDDMFNRGAWLKSEVTREARCRVTVNAKVKCRFGEAYKDATFILTAGEALSLAKWIQDTFGEQKEGE